MVEGAGDVPGGDQGGGEEKVEEGGEDGGEVPAQECEVCVS